MPRRKRSAKLHLEWMQCRNAMYSANVMPLGPERDAMLDAACNDLESKMAELLAARQFEAAFGDLLDMAEDADEPAS